MDTSTKELFEDYKNDFYPDDDEAFGKIKCTLAPGQKIKWCFKEDYDFAEKEGLNIWDDPGYEGIIVPMPWSEVAYGFDTELESDQCAIIQTNYHAEKEYCKCSWVYLHRLINNPDLFKIKDFED